MTNFADGLRSSAEPAAEPWMRNTWTELDPLRRGVIHALQLALEDVDRWVKGLTDQEMERRPDGLPSVAFHLRHIARSLDRLLTYAENRALSGEQLALLSSEHQPGAGAGTLQEFSHGVAAAISRVLQLNKSEMAEPRGIGRKRLPTTVGGLLVHSAEHTQRHAGQMVTTAKLLRYRGPADAQKRPEAS